MPGLFDYLMRKAMGKRTGDIELPSEGETDPRLPNVGESAMKAARTAKDLSEVGGSATERLQAAGRRGMERREAEKRKKFDEENRRALGR